jgi:hypothetical protein
MIWGSMTLGHNEACKMNYLRFSCLPLALSCFRTHKTKGCLFGCSFFTNYPLWQRIPNALNFIGVSISSMKGHLRFENYHFLSDDYGLFIILFSYLQPS